MKNKFCLIPKLNICVISFLAIMVGGFSAQCQQMSSMGTDSSMFKNNEKKGMDNVMNSMAHPFFTHMGMPQSVGRYSLRFANFVRPVSNWRSKST